MYILENRMKFLSRVLSRRMFCMLARQNFSKECEDILNKQITLELEAGHTYLAMAYHFDRCDIASPGLFRFFQEASMEERHHAELIMKYINKRGGCVKLEGLREPKSNFQTPKEALKCALEMEKQVNQSLLNVHKVANEANDPNMCDFIESQFLMEQVDGIKVLCDYITQLERCDKNLGDFLFDQYIQKSAAAHTKNK